MISMNFCTANFRNYHSLKDSSRDFRVQSLPLVSANRGLHYLAEFKLVYPVSLISCGLRFRRIQYFEMCNCFTDITLLWNCPVEGNFSPMWGI